MNEAAAASAPELQRSSGTVRLSFKRRGAHTVLDSLYQQGCYKARLPPPSAEQAPEAILINTSGGMTDGDHLSCIASWQPDTAALVTTQAAERIYRSREAAATVRSELHIGRDATACWLPQETILFDEGRLDRLTNVSMVSGSSLFAVESIVFGRAGMGEVVASGRVSDLWRIRIDGKLVFADSVVFENIGDSDLNTQLSHAPVANGATAIATIIYAGHDCAALLDNFRRALAQSDVVAGATNLGDLVVARVLANNGQRLRDAVMRVFSVAKFNGGDDLPHRGFELPRVWNC